MKVLFKCDICGKEYNTQIEAENCEKECGKNTVIKYVPVPYYPTYPYPYYTYLTSDGIITSKSIYGTTTAYL